VILGLPPGVTRAEVESKSKYLNLSLLVYTVECIGPSAYQTGLRGTQQNIRIYFMILYELSLHDKKITVFSGE
jgi:hypothetical protein